MEIFILLVWALWELLVMAMELAVALMSAAAWLSSAVFLLLAWMIQAAIGIAAVIAGIAALFRGGRTGGNRRAGAGARRKHGRR